MNAWLLYYANHASVLWKMLVALKILIFELRKPQKWILRAILRGTWTPLTTSNNQNWLNEAETRQKALISAPILCTLNQPKLTICPFHIHALQKYRLDSVFELCIEIHVHTCEDMCQKSVLASKMRSRQIPSVIFGNIYWFPPKIEPFLWLTKISRYFF